jgi:hypothetical protein
MLLSRPDLPQYVKGGPDTPVGPRALYLNRDRRDLRCALRSMCEPVSARRADGFRKPIDSDLRTEFQAGQNSALEAKRRDLYLPSRPPKARRSGEFLRQPHIWRFAVEWLVEPGGIEPPTS